MAASEEGKESMKRISTSETIAIFSPSLAIGGAERALVNLANAFADSKKKVHLLLAKAEGSLLSEVHPDVRVFDLGKKGVWGALPVLSRYLRTERPAILLSTLSHANLIALWAVGLSRVPTRVVITETTTMSVNFASEPGIKNKLIPQLARIFYRRANAIIAVSQGVADDLVNNIGVSRNKTHVIYNPIVTADLSKKSQEHLSHPWFAPGALPVVLAVGRLTAAKDYPTLLHAFALAREKRELHLLILGDGEKRFELEGMVRSLGLENDVQMPGFVPNPYVYMACASVFVLSSAWEGFSNVIAEALACGVPIVSTDCPSGPAELLENGKYGKLVPVGDPGAMAKAILETLDIHPDRTRLRQRSLDFTVEAVVQQYLALFNTLLERNGR